MLRLSWSVQGIVRLKQTVEALARRSKGELEYLTVTKVHLAKKEEDTLVRWVEESFRVLWPDKLSVLMLEGDLTSINKVQMQQGKDTIEQENPA